MLCSSTVAAPSSNVTVPPAVNSSDSLDRQPQRSQELPPTRWLARLDMPAQLRADADSEAELLFELPQGELLQTFRKIEECDAEDEWLLVRAPLEETVEVMSDRPLSYQIGWIHCPTTALKTTRFQLGDKLAARVDVPNHPVVELLKYFPPWRGDKLPDWVPAMCCELHTGKIGGVVKRGRFMVQRPSGAVPERLTLEAAMLQSPKERARTTVLAALLGLGFSAALGFAIHAWGWAQDKVPKIGVKTWPKLVGWLTIIVLVLSPAAIWPCYAVANSPGATFCAVAGLNMLFYTDLFTE